MKRVLTNMSAVKKLTILAVIILSIFAVINLFWAVTKGLPYYGYMHNLSKKDRDSLNIVYKTEIGDHSYAVRPPNYLYYNGGLVAGKTSGTFVSYDEHGNIVSSSGLCVVYYVWPKIRETRYGVAFYDAADELSVLTYVDRDLNFIPHANEPKAGYNAKAEKLIAEHYDEIKMMRDQAKELWGLNGICRDSWTGFQLFVHDIPVKKALLVFLYIAGGLFLLANLFWLIEIKLFIKRYTGGLNRLKEGKGTVYRKEIDGFVFTVHMPAYLRKNGNLSVENTDGSDTAVAINPAAPKKRRYTAVADNGKVRITLNSAMEYTPEKQKKEMPEDGCIEAFRAMIAEAKELWGFDVK